MKLTRYWFEFEGDLRDLPLGLGLGCGITAYNNDDAIWILKQKVFKDKPVPTIKKLVENVDVSTLDAGHVLLNMLPTTWRGVWFPLGYNYDDPSRKNNHFKNQ